MVIHCHAADRSSTPGPRRARAAAARRRGFTLIEMCVTISIAAILIGVATPSFLTLMQNGRNSNQAASMVVLLTFARNEALKRDLATGVTVCPSADGQNCDAGGNWALGWIIPDPVTPANPPLQSGLALSSSNTITEATGQKAVVFLPSGAVQSKVAFTLCDKRGAQYAREFEVNAAGRVAAASTVGQSVSGGALTCP